MINMPRMMSALELRGALRAMIVDLLACGDYVKARQLLEFFSAVPDD